MRVNTYLASKPSEDQLYQRLLALSRVVNGNIQLGNPRDGIINVLLAWLNTTTPNVQDTEFTFTHNLGYIPQGFVTVSVDKAAIIYSSRRALWTTTQMFLKANQASVALVGFGL